MKIKTRNLFVSVLSVLMMICIALCVVFGFTSPTVSVSASAQQAEAGAFVVENGASVRTEVGSSGIRFTVRISKDYYDSVKEKSPSWGVIFGIGKEDASELTLEAVGSDANVKLHGSSGTMQPELTKDESCYLIYAVISYDNAPDFELACNTKLNARAYVTYTESNANDTTVYSYVDEYTDTYRSISQVAERVLVDDLLEENIYAEDVAPTERNILKTYIQAQEVQTITSEEVAYTFDMYKAGEKKLTGVDAPDGVYQVIVDGTSMGTLSLKSGEITLGGAFPNTMTLGENYTLVLKTVSKTYIQGFKYVSKVINSESEFIEQVKFYNYNSNTVANNDVTKFYDGASFTARYFVLGDNITITDTTTDFAANKGWFDTLDGQGYMLTVNNCNYAAVFGIVGSYGTIKNLAITVKAFESTTLAKGVLANTLAAYSLIQNVSINVDLTEEESNAFCILAQKITYDAKIKDVFVHISTNATPNTESTNSYGFLAGYINASTNTYKWGSEVSNIYVVSSTIKVAGFNGTSTSASMWYANNESTDNGASDTTRLAHSIYRFDTVSDMKEDATYGASKVGDWDINADGTATWNPSAATYVPTYSEEEKQFIKSEHVVNSKEVAGTDDNEGRFLMEIEFAELPTGYEEVWFNGAKIEDAIVNGTTITLKTIPEGMTLGDVHTLTVKDASGNEYVQSFRYIHKEIATIADFVEMVHYYSNNSTSITASQYYDGETFSQRYYLMTADITLNNELSTWMSDWAFYDIFDGDGHTITATNEYPNMGLFGRYIKANAAVKNFAIQVNGNGPTSTATARLNLIAYEIEGPATVKNIAIDYSPNVEREMHENVLAYIIWKSAVIEDVYISISTNVKAPATQTDKYGFLGGAQIGGNFSNVYVSSPVMTAAYVSADGATAIYASNEQDQTNTLAGVYRYDSVAALQSAKAQVGNWVISADEDGNAVYTYNKNTYAGSTLTVGGASTEYVEMYAGEKLVLSEGATAVSADESVVKVEDGKLVALQKGKTVVTLSNATETRIVYVEVFAGANDAIFAATSETLSVGDTADLSLVLDGVAVDGYKCYTVDTIGVLSVSGDTVTAEAAGEVTLTVAYQINGTVATKSITITVSA